MLVRHGYIILTREREIIPDPTMVADEDILCVMGIDGVTFVRLGMMMAGNNPNVYQTATLKTHSIGFLVTHAINIIENSKVFIEYKWVDAFRQQVIHISTIANNEAEQFDSYIIPTSDGYFLVGGGEGCHRILDTDVPLDIFKMHRCNHDRELTRFYHPRDRPAIKRVKAFSDVSVIFFDGRTDHQKMPIDHGYIILNRSRQIIPDPSRKGTDENIRYIPKGPNRQMRIIRVGVMYDAQATLRTHSIGYLLTHAINTNTLGYAIKYEWVDRFSQQVICISTKVADGYCFKNYVVPTCEGYFIVPKYGVDAWCYRIDEDDLIADIDKMHRYEHTREMTRWCHPRDRPAIKRVKAFSDVVVAIFFECRVIAKKCLSHVMDTSYSRAIEKSSWIQPKPMPMNPLGSHSMSLYLSTTVYSIPSCKSSASGIGYNRP